jgi:hypothetical protein
VVLAQHFLHNLTKTVVRVVLAVVVETMLARGTLVLVVLRRVLWVTRAVTLRSGKGYQLVLLVEVVARGLLVATGQQG